MSGQGIPAPASLPVPPPLASMPMVDVKTGCWTQSGLQLIQRMWAAIFGSAGIVDLETYLINQAQAPALTYSDSTLTQAILRAAARGIPVDAPRHPYTANIPQDRPRNVYFPFLPPDSAPPLVRRECLGYLLQTPIDAFSITMQDGLTSLILNPAGTLATGTIITAPNPYDGQIFILASSQQVTVLTMTANTGQTLNGGLTTILANGSAQWQYVLSLATWFLIG